MTHGKLNQSCSGYWGWDLKGRNSPPSSLGYSDPSMENLCPPPSFHSLSINKVYMSWSPHWRSQEPTQVNKGSFWGYKHINQKTLLSWQLPPPNCMLWATAVSLGLVLCQSVLGSGTCCWESEWASCLLGRCSSKQKFSDRNPASFQIVFLNSYTPLFSVQ